MTSTIKRSGSRFEIICMAPRGLSVVSTSYPSLLRTNCTSAFANWSSSTTRMYITLPLFSSKNYKRLFLMTTQHAFLKAYDRHEALHFKPGHLRGGGRA